MCVKGDGYNRTSLVRNLIYILTLCLPVTVTNRVQHRISRQLAQTRKSEKIVLYYRR